MGWEPSHVCVWPSLALHLHRDNGGQLPSCFAFHGCLWGSPTGELLGGERLTQQSPGDSWLQSLCDTLAFSTRCHGYRQLLILLQIPWKVLSREGMCLKLSLWTRHTGDVIPPLLTSGRGRRGCHLQCSFLWLILRILSRCQHGGWNSTAGFCSVTVPGSEQEK